MSESTVPSRIALVVHPTRHVDEALDSLRRWAGKKGIDLVQLTLGGGTHQQVAVDGELETDDLVIAVGGDGTVPAALRAAAGKNAPVLGVAAGSLGALSAVSAEELGDGLDRLWSGEWTRRLLPALAVRPEGAPNDWAVNDFVVVRRGAGQLIVHLSLDDELYARMAGDGLVVATAVGSSAYSMAAGGPVLAADTAAFVCTPLDKHGGSAPPLVVPGDATVTVEVNPTYAGFDVEIDGKRHQPAAERFHVNLDEGRFTLVTFGASD